MAHSDLIDHLLGASSEEIGQRYTTSKSAEEVDKTIAYETGQARAESAQEDIGRCGRAATW